MRIAIDIDSTLHPYWEQLAGIARRRFGIDLPYEDQVEWKIAQLKPAQLEVCVRETHDEATICSAKPYPGAVDVVRRWHEAGHFIHITSHRPDTTRPATERWLQDIGLPYDELRCDWDKVPHCKKIQIDLLVDDSPVNLEEAIDAGIRVATLDHPWNREIRETEDVIVGADWDELAEALQPLLAQAGTTQQTP